MYLVIKNSPVSGVGGGCVGVGGCAGCGVGGALPLPLPLALPVPLATPDTAGADSVAATAAVDVIHVTGAGDDAALTALDALVVIGVCRKSIWVRKEHKK